MSSDLGLLCFENGKPAPLSCEIVRRALEPFVARVDDGDWVLSFPGGGGGDMSIPEDDGSTGLCIGHPCGTGLFDALYEIMRQTHTLMWWSGVDDMITADESIADHLPPDYIEKFGVPPLVRSGADILAEIAKT